MTATQASPSQRERELGAIIGAYNEVTERLKLSHDRLVSEVRRLHDQLEEKNRELSRRERLAALGEMAAGVAHEIRNPLGGIQLYASLLSRDLADRPEARRLAEKISAGVRTLDGIVGDVLVFAGNARPQATGVDLEAVVRECLELSSPEWSARRIEMHLSRSVCGPRLFVDPKQFQRALLNLLLNAIDAVDEGGHVWIEAREDLPERCCDVIVADDGPGIPRELMDRIFNPFFTTKDSGTGLGLAIVHRIAESNGGRVRARGREGGGAELVLTLPLHDALRVTDRRGPGASQEDGKWPESA